MTFQSTLKIIPIISVLILSGFCGETARAGSLTATGGADLQARADTTSVQSEPYESSKSVAGHILSLPSYAFYWTTRPIGYGFKKAEKNLPRLFQGERGEYGVFPLFELGGDTGFSYGLLLFHNSPFYPNHSARVEALFSSSDYNDIDFDYTINRFLSDNGQLNINAVYANRPDRSFLFGNDVDFDDRSFFDREDIEIALSYSHIFSDKTVFRFHTDYLQRDIKESDRELEEGAPAFPNSFLGDASLISTGIEIAIDNAKGVPRINRGNRLITEVQWSRSLTNNRFHYVNFGTEWNQFIPLPYLPDDRRLALKGVLRKAEALGNKEIPFFETPVLGNSRDLRGFSTDRFRDTGSLLLAAEYRYPMWNFSDVVLFVEEGQVFNDFSDISIDDFHTSYGFGFHLISAKGFAFRSEFAFSRDNSRFILSISPNF